jgi:diguanylate cyclase (GGDEF)-like protein/PAS domain S-box-containing protein
MIGSVLRRWVFLRWPARLRGQAYSHLTMVLLIATSGILLIGTVSFNMINDRDIKQREAQLREHYLAVLPRLESTWLSAAVQVRSRIEFLRILEEPEETSFPKLTAFLNAQWTLSEFSNLVVLDHDNRVIYHHGSESLSLQNLVGDQANWIYAQEFRQLYRVFQVSIWLGARGEGRLLLFKSLSNAMLRDLVIPQTNLQLWYLDQQVGQSHDAPATHGGSILQIRIPWPQIGGGQGPVLEVQRELTDLLPYSSFIIRPIGVIAFIAVLLWLGLGRWLAQTAQRIEVLGKCASLFAAGTRTAALSDELALARFQADEIGETAQAFEQMAKVVEKRDLEQQSYLETLSLLEEAVIELDQAGVVLRASPGWGKLTHCDENIGREIFESVHPHDVEMLQAQFTALSNGEKQQVTLRLRLRPESVNVQHDVWIECRLLSHRDADSRITGIRGVLRDITQTYLHEKQITHMALHDALTGLPNRVLLEDRIKIALRLAGRNGQLVGVCFIDLDHFKVVNDSLGHKAGDRLLIAFAERLRDELRIGDTLARWGGDEFVLLLPDMDSETDIRQVADKVVRALQQPLDLDGSETRVTFSMGAAVFPSDGNEGETLFSHADRAMFFAKAQGRNQVCFFQDMESKGLGNKELYIQNRLTQAIDQGKIETWFQPIVDADSGCCTSVEVLARWHDEEYGWISPVTFIPMAENLGMIRELGLHILKSSLDAAREWHAQGISALLAVNVSKRQLFTHSFTEHLLSEVAARGLTPAMVVLEVTESVALSDVKNGAERVSELRQAGFHIAIDDFGTGYSSLSQLHEMHADELKIDISFVRRLDQPSGLSLVQAIINMASLFGMKTVAEGVEDSATADKLRSLGVNCLQGYFFGKPMPRAEFMAWLQAQPDPLDGVCQPRQNGAAAPT